MRNRTRPSCRASESLPGVLTSRALEYPQWIFRITKAFVPEVIAMAIRQLAISSYFQLKSYSWAPSLEPYLMKILNQRPWHISLGYAWVGLGSRLFWEVSFLPPKPLEVGLDPVGALLLDRYLHLVEDPGFRHSDWQVDHVHESHVRLGLLG